MVTFFTIIEDALSGSEVIGILDDGRNALATTDTKTSQAKAAL